MNIDSGSPVFRYIDKAILAVAGVVALWAVGRALWGSSPAGQIIAQVTRAIEDTGRAAKSRQLPSFEVPEELSRLSARFDPETIDEPNPFRLFVFFSPDEIIGDPVVVQYLKGSTLAEREPAYCHITAQYKERHPELEEVDYAKAKVIVIPPKDKNIAKLALDVEHKALVIEPRKPGVATVRVEFAEGPTFEFQLTVEETVAPKVAMPEPPQNLRATAHKGYITLTWETNPDSCPAASYKIYRADGPYEPDKQVDEIKVEGLESSQTDKAKDKEKEDEETPELVLQKYGWDDFDVTPGTTYYYSIQTTGMVKEPDAEKAVEKVSASGSARVRVTALSPITVTLLRGMRGMAIFEVELQEGFVPQFRSCSARPGEKIGEGRFASGHMLVDAEELPREYEEERRVPVVKEDGSISLERKWVRFIRDELRAIVVNSNNEAVVKWKDRGRRQRLQKRVRDLFTTLPSLADKRLPKSKEEPGDSKTPKITITNRSGREVLTIVARGKRQQVILEVPPNWSRTIGLTAGEYELIGGYLVKKADESDPEKIDPAKSKVFKAKTVRFERNKHYRFEIDRPKDKAVGVAKGDAAKE